MTDQRQEERRVRPRRKVDRHKGRINRLFGLFFVLCMVAGYISLQSQQNQTKTNRVEGVSERCVLIKVLLDTLVDAHAPERLSDRLARSYGKCQKVLVQAKKDAG